jgi:hypothetical protein
MAVAVTLCLTACATSQGDDVAPATQVAAPVARSPAAATPYYVEFHSRPSIVSGHTYLVYGALDANGAPTSQDVVGFYPDAGLFGLVAGLVAFPGTVGQDFFDEKIPDYNSWRRNLTVEQYRRLTAFIDGEKAKAKVWNLLVNNCNDFAADAATAIGLKAPSERAIPPPLFIMALRSLNG